MDMEKLKRWYPWITLALLTVIVGIIDPTFLRPSNLLNTAADISTLFIMALGMTFVIYIGGIDLSSQSIANMITVIATILIAKMGGYTAFACMGAGLVMGLLSGFVTTKLKVPSFIATLAIGGVALSISQFASGQRALYMDADLRDEVFGWMIGNTMGVPNEIGIAAALLIIALVIERRTPLGRSLKAIGSGELAANASGINVDRCKIAAFAISGCFAALAGLLFSVNLAGGAPTIAEGFLLPAIVAVLVGGTPLTGGVGGVLNTLAGAMIIAVIRVSMLYFEIPATDQQIFFGIVLIIAIAFTIDRSKLSIVK